VATLSTQSTHVSDQSTRCEYSEYHMGPQSTLWLLRVPARPEAKCVHGRSTAVRIFDVFVRESTCAASARATNLQSIHSSREYSRTLSGG
jgi:hypothetical protein